MSLLPRTRLDTVRAAGLRGGPAHGRTHAHTSLRLDQLLPDGQRDEGRAVQDDVGDGPPRVGRQSLGGRNEVASRIVNHDLPGDTWLP